MSLRRKSAENKCFRVPKDTQSYRKFIYTRNLEVLYRFFLEVFVLVPSRVFPYDAIGSMSPPSDGAQVYSKSSTAHSRSILATQKPPAGG